MNKRFLLISVLLIPLTGCDFINDIINPLDPPSPPEPPIVVDGDELLTYVKPDMIFTMSGILSSNQENTPLEDQHPYIEAVERMSKYCTSIYWSSINRESTFTSKGDAFTFASLGRTVDYYVDGEIVNREEEKDISFLDSAWYKSLKTNI